MLAGIFRPLTRMARLTGAALALFLMTFCLSCASLVPGLRPPASEHRTVFEVQHTHSSKPSDCLAVCTGMVLQYYDVQTIVPDTTLPLDLITLSKRLNTDTPVDEEGHVVFSTVLQLAPEELMAQLAKKRPLIVAFKPSARKAYHSVVVSGYSTDGTRLYVNDPARRKPSWKKLSKLPTFEDSGKYLVLLIGLREA